MFDRIKLFFEEARTEFRHVNWPTRAEAIRLTGVVIGLAIGLAVLLGLFDYLFTTGLGYFIQHVAVN
jgi:preprotein translocase subunit SecE